MKMFFITKRVDRKNIFHSVQTPYMHSVYGNVLVCAYVLNCEEKKVSSGAPVVQWSYGTRSRRPRSSQYSHRHWERRGAFLNENGQSRCDYDTIHLSNVYIFLQITYFQEHFSKYVVLSDMIRKSLLLEFLDALYYY